MGSRVCATIVLNRTISDEEFGQYKWYQSMISSQKFVSEDTSPQGSWIVTSHIAWRENDNDPYMEDLRLNTNETFS